MSPYFNFGYISVQAAILRVKAAAKENSIPSDAVKSFVEEAVVRRELSDNFCFYNPLYDSLKGASSWAQESLQAHASDKRDYVYSLKDLAQSNTHDDLWNAAQRQLVLEGGQHGFLRMYWCKKVLEWTESPEQALDFGQKLNDRYALDGNDPNGYVGVGWSIMGIHDMGWKERPIFGKIRFMNYNGCKRKFNIPQFVAMYPLKSIKRERESDKNVSSTSKTSSKKVKQES
jgi:deoxyribodipyrimidine photo-lyase